MYCKYFKINLKDVSYYNAMLGHFPKSAQINVSYKTSQLNIIIFDNLDSKIAINYIDINNSSKLIVVNLQLILFYLLYKSDGLNYNIALNLINVNCKSIDNCEVNVDCNLKCKYNTGLSLTTYGIKNIPPSVIYSIDKFNDQKVSVQVPKDLFPDAEECNAYNTFDYNSVYFAIDGQKINS
jgi:hypothetical protein